MESKEKVEKQIEEICQQIEEVEAKGSKNLRLLEELCKEITILTSNEEEKAKKTNSSWGS